MRLSELFEGAKLTKRQRKEAGLKPNTVAKHANLAGKAGSHSDTKYNRKEKHKGKEITE